MKLQFDNDSSSNLMDTQDLSSDVTSANQSTEVTEMLRKGIKAAQEGERAEARHLLMQATELEPNNENAWLWLASISEYPEELLIFLNNVLKVNPKNERALEWEKSTKTLLSKTFVQRGIEASKDSQAAFAKQCFLQAIVHDDKNEMAWLWLASISNSVDEKKSHLQKVLKINPENETAAGLLKSIQTEMAEALLRKAQIEAVSGEKDQAKKFLADVFKQAPELEGAWMLKCYLTDSFAKKLEYLEKTVEINSGNEQAAAALAALRSVGELTEPKPDSSAVKDFELKIDAPVVLPEPPEDDSIEILEMSEAVPESIEDIDVSAAIPQPVYLTEQMAEFPTQDFKLPVAPEQTENAMDVSEVSPPQQIEQVEDSAEQAAEDVSQDVQELTVEKTVDETHESPESLSFGETAVEEISAVEEDSETLYFEETVVEEPVFAEEEVEAEPESDVLTEVGEVSMEASEEPEAVTEESAAAEYAPEMDSPSADKPKAEAVLCYFCDAENEAHAFICHSCRAMLTISDIEMMLTYPDADAEKVQRKVNMLEAENNATGLDAEGLKILGIGSLNLKNLRKGHEYLQEAAHLDPNDVVLSSHVNSLAIRLSEMEDQKSHQDSIPKNKSILVVDDSATVRKLVSGKLEKCGLEVICAVDGMDALEKINENIPDLILLDITMPRMDGYQVCKLIRGNEATKDVPVVMISGKDGFFDKVRGRMAGTTGYITKPFGPETLMKTVEAYID